MEDLMIIDNAYFECFTNCKESEVSANIERAKEYYERDKKCYESHLVEYPDNAEYWQGQLDKVKKVLESGFRAVTWEEFKKLQREKWLSKEPEEVTYEQYNYALEVVPPKKICSNERFFMFFVGECTTMSFYGNYLYERATGKYYYAMADILDKSTWLDKMLNL